MVQALGVLSGSGFAGIWGSGHRVLRVRILRV